MADDPNPTPARYPGIMISSTFRDLAQHRAAVIKAIDDQEMKSVAMEHDTAKPDVDVIDSSLRMVRQASAYVAMIGHKYGQVPECPRRNPGRLSLTELEFNEAIRLGRPVLLFIMGDDHDVKPGHVERNPQKIAKLDAFRERAKQFRRDSSIHRVYTVFNNLQEFEVAATRSVADLRRFLDQKVQSPPAEPARDPAPVSAAEKSIPSPPAFYAEPPYIGSHQFVGRAAEINLLSDWAAAASPHPLLLLEAIGGSGKSMLTWEWTTKHATGVRDWAGRFWYSFYDKGAVMADFCARALAYTTGRPLDDFRGMKTAELSERLLHRLRDRPWLVVLDGLERVLVAYHRFDAAQLRDEEAGGSDQIARRDPCAAIRPEDDELLRALAGAAPSKLLVTSRLVPRVLVNAAGQPIPGVAHTRLPGLRPADAEALLRSCGVTGTSADIQRYLQAHCDCHPLVTGVLAGLVHGYLRDRGHFDAWTADPAHGGALNMASLDLVQKRNHILVAALAALPEPGRQLLSTLALLHEAADYPALLAFNPHLPPAPEVVEEPERPEDGRRWDSMSSVQKRRARRDYAAAVERRRAYEHAVKTRHESAEFLAAPDKLASTVRDLERRGLLQYDGGARRYDLHPVVRGVAAGGLRPEDTERYGQRVVDHFSSQAHGPYVETQTLDDVRPGLHVVRTLLQMGRRQQAVGVYRGELSQALLFNLAATAEILSLLRPFFPQGWAALPAGVNEGDGSYLLNDAGLALRHTGAPRESLAAYGVALTSDVERREWQAMRVILANVASALGELNRKASEERCLKLALDLAVLIGDDDHVFRARLNRFAQLAEMGRWDEAEAMWQLLDPMDRPRVRALYRPGEAEVAYARFRVYRGDLGEEHLVRAEQLAATGKERAIIRSLHELRGEWRLERAEWAAATDSLHEAVRMAHEVGQSAPHAETLLALARLHLDQLADPRQEAERLADARDVSHLALAALWLAVGDRERATEHALAAYERAWGDGEPYVRRYRLDKARDLLIQLGAEIPSLPPYDPARDEKLPWEDAVVAAIETLRAEKRAEEGGETGKKD